MPTDERAIPPWQWRVALRDHGPRSGAVLLTLHTIATYMNNEGRAFPSQSTIAAGARVTVRAVQRHIAIAVRAGWLTVSTVHGQGQGWRANEYRASIPREVRNVATVVSSPKVATPASPRSEGDDTGRRNVTTLAAKRDDTGVALTLRTTLQRTLRGRASTEDGLDRAEPAEVKEQRKQEQLEKLRAKGVAV